MNDAPDVWPDEAAKEPLEEAHEEDVVVEAFVVDAGADHCADATGHWDEVQDGTDQGMIVLERQDGVFAAVRAAGASFQIGHLSK